MAIGLADMTAGSSPLTRGAHDGNRVSRHDGGLIPAYAGSTVVVRRATCVSAAHPRLRGEHVMRCFTVPHAPGSSPLTRGALGIITGWGGGLGLIPAYAGSTWTE